MKTARVIQLLSAVALVAMVSGAICSAATAGNASEKTAKAVVLPEPTMRDIMRHLGLIDADGKAINTFWLRETAEASVSDVIPSGIDMIVPHKGDNTLIIYGEKKAVEEFAGVLALSRQMVRVKAELYAVDAEQVKQLGMDDMLKVDTLEAIGRTASISPSVLASLRESLGQPTAMPVIETFSNILGETQVDWEQETVNLSVMPRVNADGTITLSADWKIRTITSTDLTQDPPATATHSFRSNRRVADGESVVMVSAKNLWLGVRLLVVTASVVRDATNH